MPCVNVSILVGEKGCSFELVRMAAALQEAVLSLGNGTHAGVVYLLRVGSDRTKTKLGYSENLQDRLTRHCEHLSVRNYCFKKSRSPVSPIFSPVSLGCKIFKFQDPNSAGPAIIIGLGVMRDGTPPGSIKSAEVKETCCNAEANVQVSAHTRANARKRARAHA